MVNTLIEQFVGNLKKENVYLNYINAKQNLDKHAFLLQDYKTTKEEYIKMKPYFKYQDFRELKERFHLLSTQVSELDAYQQYINASHELKDRLDELTQIIFDGILIEAGEKQCVSSQESINEEI